MRSEEHEQTQEPTELKKPLFQIEKLEERIAPAKGGIPGPPGREPCDLPRWLC